MSVKLQINLSTGKLSFNAVTGKVHVVASQVVSPCIHCVTTPFELSVTLSNILSNADGCINCSNVGVPVSDRVWTGVPPNINGTYTLQQDPISPCTWNYQEEANFTQDIYESEDGSCTTFDFQNIGTAWGINVRYEVYPPDPTKTWFLFIYWIRNGTRVNAGLQSRYTKDSGCLEKTDVLNFPFVSTDGCFPFYDSTPQSGFVLTEIA